MLVSVSRRTDVPALYADWFMGRVRAGFADVVNPFNPRQVSRVPLRPRGEGGEVDALVFWSRFPRPLLGHLAELAARGLPSVFMLTLTGYPRALEPRGPSISARIRVFRELSKIVGPERLRWRYDPVYFSQRTDAAWHRATFARLARELQGATRSVVVSLFDDYRKTRSRLAALASQGYGYEMPERELVLELFRDFRRVAEDTGLAIQSCAESSGLEEAGIPPGACIDTDWINRALSLSLELPGDPSQRANCRCAASRDIGAYESCTFSCAYCYAVGSFPRARAHHRSFDPASTSLAGLPPARTDQHSLL